MRHCTGICDRLEYIKSLRWVGNNNKRQFKRCYKCDKYFKTVRIQCECCKDTLRVYYRLPNMGRRKRIFKATVYYLINQSDILLRRLIDYELGLKVRYKHSMAKRRKHNKHYYKANCEQIKLKRRLRYAKSIVNHVDVT